MDRLLLNPWISRTANAAFLVSVVLFIVRIVKGWSPLTIVVVVLLVIGVTLMVAQFVERRRQRRAAKRTEEQPAREPEPEPEPEPERAPAPTLREELVAMIEEGLGIAGLLSTFHGTAYAMSRFTFEFSPTHPRVRDYLRRAQALIHRVEPGKGDPSVFDGIEGFERAEEAVVATIATLTELAAHEPGGRFDAVARVVGEEADNLLEGMNMQVSGGKVAREDWYIDATVRWELRMEEALRSAGADELDLAEFRSATAADLRALASSEDGHVTRMMAHVEERRERARGIVRELRSRAA